MAKNKKSRRPLESQNPQAPKGQTPASSNVDTSPPTQNNRIYSWIQSQDWHFLPAAFISSIIFWAHSDYVPMWDSGSYIMTCFQPAVEKPFNLLNFDCSNHGSIAYALLMSLSQFIWFGNLVGLHFISWVIYASAIWAFSSWYDSLFSNASRIEKYLAPCVLAFFPHILSNALNPTPDFAVFAFFLLHSVFLLRDNTFWASVAGAMLVFSKELGIGLCGLNLLIWTAAKIGRAEVSIKRITALWRRHWPLYIPVFLFLFFIIYKLVFVPEKFFVNLVNQSHSDSLSGLFRFTLDRMYLGALAGIWAMNFMWVLTVSIGVCLVGVLYFQFTGRKQFLKELPTRFQLVHLLLIFTIPYHVISTYRHYLNVRYYLAVYPTIFLIFFVLSRVVIRQWKIRAFVSALMSILFLVSSFRTVDPVSKGIFGTFEFGNHEMLKMTSLSGECCGYGRDQLVYNLEHIHIQRLYNKFLSDNFPTPQTGFFVDPYAEFYVQGPINLATRQRSIYGPNRIFPNHFFISQDGLQRFSTVSDRFNKFYFLAFPNFERSHLEAILDAKFHLMPIERIQQGEYAFYFREIKPR